MASCGPTSLSSADRYQATGSRASAFLVQTFPQSRRLVRFGNNLLSILERTVSSGSRSYGQVAKAYINACYPSREFGCRVSYLNRKCDQQVELFLWLVIPEFRSTNLSTSTQQLQDFVGASTNASLLCSHVMHLQLAHQSQDRAIEGAISMTARKRGIAASLHQLGSAMYVLGEVKKGWALGEESLSLYREAGDSGNSAEVLLYLEIAAFFRGEYNQARSLFEESLALFEVVDEVWGKASALHYLGFICCTQEQYTRARQLSEVSLALIRRLGTLYRTSEVMTLLAYELVALGEETGARALLEEALAVARARACRGSGAYVLGSGHLALRQGSLTEAQTLNQTVWVRQRPVIPQASMLKRRISWQDCSSRHTFSLCTKRAGSGAISHPV